MEPAALAELIGDTLDWARGQTPLSLIREVDSYAGPEVFVTTVDDRRFVIRVELVGAGE